MNKIYRAALAALVLCAGSPGLATAQEPTDLAAKAAAARQEAGAPALGFIVVRAGGETELAVDGVRVAGNDALVTAEDRWHWGSITKSITATLVARLVEQGIVSWDDTVGDRLFELVPEMNLDHGDATFRHLLSHHAGLAANIPIGRFAEFGQTPDDPIADRLEWVRIALTQEPVGPKETTYLYSNNGYIVAAAMLEAVTGSSWEELTQKEVFEPLGLAGAGFGPPQGAEPHDQPRGHTSKAGADQPVPLDTDNPAALGPAGRVHMPLADMARYLSAHAQKRADFLSPASYETLHTTPFGGIYAMGWVVTRPAGHWHNGSNTMWYAEVAFDLEEGTVAAVAVNDGDIASVQPAVSALLQALMKGQD